jgi:hypothetical protein
MLARHAGSTARDWIKEAAQTKKRGDSEHFGEEGEPLSCPVRLREVCYAEGQVRKRL